VTLTAESKLDKLESLSLEIDVPPSFVQQLEFLTGNNDLSSQIDTFNNEVKSEGKAVGSVKFKVAIKDPIQLLSSYGSVAQSVLEISKSSTIQDFTGDLYETVGNILSAIRQTQSSISTEVVAEATQAVYINAEAGIKVKGKLGLKDMTTITKVLY
jgi:hypothetical protein